MNDRYYSWPSHSMDVGAKAAHLRERAKAIGDACESAKCDALREFANLYASFAGCMELLAKSLPYKAGDRVRLTRAPKCEGGWASSSHFLIIGAIGTVKVVEIDYLMRDWYLLIEFDDESYITSTDFVHWETKVAYKAGEVVVTPPERRHVYGFRPALVELLSTEKAPFALCSP